MFVANIGRITQAGPPCTTWLSGPDTPGRSLFGDLTMYQILKLNELSWYYGSGEIMKLTCNKQFALLLRSVWESFNVIAGNLHRYDLFVVWGVIVGNCLVMLPKRVVIAQFHFGFHIEGHLMNLVLNQSCFHYPYRSDAIQHT